jgi:arsenical pump membrane protein
MGNDPAGCWQMPAHDDRARTPDERSGRSVVLAGWATATAGMVLVVVSFVADPSTARSATAQVWSPFVLVAGLILIGLVADDDGLFAALGQRLASLAPNGPVLFGGAAVLVAGVTAVLNLDTSVVFLTPVLVYAARSRGSDPTPLLIVCILVSNAGSLLLPGSNLTNLIVLGHLHLSGGGFAARMALPWLGSFLVTAVVVGIVEHRELRTTTIRPALPREPVVVGLGVAAVIVAVVCVVVLRNAAVPVALVGLGAVTVRAVTGKQRIGHVGEVLGVPVLVGLFGLAVALGTVGRSWSGPSTVLSHLGAPATTAFAAVASVVVNNLPAAALLAAHVPPHPFALLIGLDVGPNLFVTGSLAWVLWVRTTRVAGCRPPVTRAVVLGLVSAPLAMVAALGLLGVTGAR